MCVSVCVLLLCIFSCVCMCILPVGMSNIRRTSADLTKKKKPTIKCQLEWEAAVSGSQFVQKLGQYITSLLWALHQSSLTWDLLACGFQEHFNQTNTAGEEDPGVKLSRVVLYSSWVWISLDLSQMVKTNSFFFSTYYVPGTVVSTLHEAPYVIHTITLQY